MLSHLYRRLPSGFIHHQNLKFMNYTKTTSKQILFIVVFFLAILLISWKTKSLRTEDSRWTGTNRQYSELKNFPVLRIKKDTIIRWFQKEPGSGNPKIHKLVFKFDIDNAINSNPSLRIFRAKENKRGYIPPPPPRLPPPAHDPFTTPLERMNKTCEILGQYTLGNLEIHKDDWATLLGKAENNDTYLYFYPKRQLKDGVYSIVYLLYWGGDALPTNDCPGGGIALLAEDGALNPSPPADPR